MTQSNAPPVSGLVAGKYEVTRIIGRGGMGSVWEGRHATLGTRVAIKFIDPEYAESEEAQARFANEARAAAAIQSKHAIHIYDHGLTSDLRPYIVMELLTGEALDKRLDAVGRLPLAETARILGQVCRALQRAHEAGIIHRDLKPENIFLVRTPDDDEEIAKVLDFGIAKMKAPPGEQGLSSSTKTGAVMGTPFYMSPEQARGLRSIDHRSDLWSLGIIAYRCVTGVLPFDGESVGDLLVKICTVPLPVPSAVVPGVPASFDAWFAKALEREPAARFQTALDLADALALAAGVSVRRGPMSSQKTPGHTPAPRFASPIAPTLEHLPTAPAGALTSPPFVSSKSPSTPPRKTLVAIAVTGVVVGSIGVAAGVKGLGSGRAAAGSASSAMAAASAAPGPVAPAAATSAPAPETNPAALVSLPSPRPTGAPGAWAAPTRSAKPGPSAKPPSTPSAPPATPVPAASTPTTTPTPAPPSPAAAPAPAPKASAKPAPATDDPGY